MFTGRGQRYCALRLPDPCSDEPVIGYAGIRGRPMQIEPAIFPVLTDSWLPIGKPGQMGNFLDLGEITLSGEGQTRTSPWHARVVAQ